MKTLSRSRVLMASAAVAALTLGFGIQNGAPFGVTAAYAQSGSGHAGSGGQGGSGHAGSGGQGGGGQGQGGQGKGQGGSSATHGKGIESHVFEEDEGPSDEAKGPQYGGGRATTGKPGTAGTKKGTDLSDLWVILRDDNGVPILKDGKYVQPIAEDGSLIPLDAEGAPLPEYANLVQEVELGRTNVGRAPTKVLDRSLEEAVSAINAADSVKLDDSGRLVVVTDGVEKTIDSPTENLALYKAILSTGTIPGITDTSKLGDLSYLADGQKTEADLKAATGFLAGATDKTAPLTIDEIVYLDQILGIPGTIVVDGKTYVDFSSFTYDRQATYGDLTAQVLLENPDNPGTYETKTVNVYDTVFDGKQETGTNIDGFTDASDDARAVLLYLHDNAPR